MEVTPQPGTPETPGPTTPPSDVLQVSYIYAKTWDEFNTRMSARHALIIQYLNLSVALLGILLLNPDPLDRLARAPYYAVPSIALITALLLYTHDLSMNSLIKYMVYLEKSYSTVNSYHALERDSKGRFSQSWGYAKVRYRLYQSLCITAIFLIFCWLAFQWGTTRDKLTDPEHAFVFWTPAVIAVALKLLSIVGRYRACIFDPKDMKQKP
jgi:hypothetical protein